MAVYDCVLLRMLHAIGDEVRCVSSCSFCALFLQMNIDSLKCESAKMPRITSNEIFKILQLIFVNEAVSFHKTRLKDISSFETQKKRGGSAWEQNSCGCGTREAAFRDTEGSDGCQRSQRGHKFTGLSWLAGEMRSLL